MSPLLDRIGAALECADSLLSEYMLNAGIEDARTAVAQLRAEEAARVAAESIGQVINSLASSFADDIATMSQPDLESHWFFKWDDKASVEWNVYQFHDLLKLYGSFCRRWEEKHNGSCCVVERVRDTYLMPKIREFAARMNAAPQASGGVSEADLIRLCQLARDAVNAGYSWLPDTDRAKIDAIETALTAALGGGK